MEKQAYIPHVINWARTQGFEDIKANMPENDDFETPISYGRQQDDEEFIPDVTGKHFQEKSYFEVVLKTSRTSRMISKLKLMGVLATRNEGKLYLMVPKGHLQFAKKIAKESQVVAQIVSLNLR